MNNTLFAFIFAAYVVFTWFYISRARPFFREIGLWAREQRDVCGARL